MFFPNRVPSFLGILSRSLGDSSRDGNALLVQRCFGQFKSYWDPQPDLI